MCLLLYFINPNAKDDEFYLILVNIRDEVYNRPTVNSHFWCDHPDVIGGLDHEKGKEGGTWFAMSKTGKIGALLNVLQPDDEIVAGKKGRGFLVVDYVTGNEDCYEYLNKVSSEKDSYNGFTLVTMDISSMKSPKVAYFSNISSSTPTIINSTVLGYHAFGNSISVDCPWPKVTKAQEKFQRIVRCYRQVEKKDKLICSLLELVNDRTCYKIDENMKKQGRSKTSEFMDKLSCIYVHMPEYNYGSRCQTIVLIEGSGKVHYLEKHRCGEHFPADWRIKEFEFELKCNDEASS